MTQSGLSRTKGTGRNRYQWVSTALNQSRLLSAGLNQSQLVSAGLDGSAGLGDYPVNHPDRERKPDAETTAHMCLTAKLAQAKLGMGSRWVVVVMVGAMGARGSHHRPRWVGDGQT